LCIGRGTPRGEQIGARADLIWEAEVQGLARLAQIAGTMQLGPVPA